MKYTASSVEKLQRDICLPPMRGCETVSTREVFVRSSDENVKNDVTEQPTITFNRIGHTASEEEAGLNEAVDGEIANNVFEQKPKKYDAEQSPTSDSCEQNDSVLGPTSESNVVKEPLEREGKMHAAGSFLVIESP